jgi:hypothetical protein
MKTLETPSRAYNLLLSMEVEAVAADTEAAAFEAAEGAFEAAALAFAAAEAAAFAALTFAVRDALALPSGCKLGDEPSLLELRDGPQDLANQNGGRGVLKEERRGGCGNEGNPLRLQHVVAGELHHEIAGEPIGALDNDSPRAIGQQAL